MTSSKQLVLLLAIALVAGAAAHRLGLGAVLDADRSPHRSLLDKREVSAEAVERQRILAELEEVHQLRERMLQEGTTAFVSASFPHFLVTCKHCCTECHTSIMSHGPTQATVQHHRASLDMLCNLVPFVALKCHQIAGACA